jgi:hypothetical protein
VRKSGPSASLESDKGSPIHLCGGVGSAMTAILQGSPPNCLDIEAFGGFRAGRKSEQENAA